MDLNPRRNFAFAIDCVLYFAMILIPMIGAQFLPEPLSKISVAGIPIAILYIVFRDGFGGQSIGKRLMKVQLIHEQSGMPISFGTAFIRGFLTSLPILGWIDFALVIFTRENQRYSDKLLRVRLVKV